jgi:hypothetical protein
MWFAHVGMLVQPLLPFVGVHMLPEHAERDGHALQPIMPGPICIPAAGAFTQRNVQGQRLAAALHQGDHVLRLIGRCGRQACSSSTGSSLRR